MEKAVRRVLVTGGSGYIACHVIDLLLRSPHKYLVRATVRDKSNLKKVKPLVDLAGEDQGRLELVQADLLKAQSWDSAVQDCQIVLHLASPFPSKQPKDQNDLIRPAIQGTSNVLKACLRHKVQHVVVTSSIAAIFPGHNQKNNFTCQDWSNLQSPDCLAYDKSKTLAQRQARRIHSQNKNTFKLTTINPGFVLGPAFYDNDSTSGVFMKRLLSNDMPGIPDVCFGTVDVRDVAAAHIFAFEKPNTDGKRYILTEGTHHWKEIIALVEGEFKQYGYKFPGFTVGSVMLRIASWFDSEVKSILPMVGRNIVFDNGPSVRELGIKYIDAKKTLIEMAYRMIRMGVVPNKLPK